MLQLLAMLACVVFQCQLCGKSGSISILDGGVRRYTAEDSESGKFVPLIKLDCRGIEPLEFIPKDGWEAEGAETSTKFTDIDLSEGDFSEYDEKAEASVGIYNFTSKVVVSK